MITRVSALALALSVSLPVSVPAMAQANTIDRNVVKVIDKRINALESQMRAVQREVFPGGDKRFFAPEITPETAADESTGQAATNPMVDLIQRVEGLERQQRELTGQVEQLQHQLRQQQEALNKFRGDAEYRLDVLEGKSPEEIAAAKKADAAPAPDAPKSTSTAEETEKKPATAEAAPKPPADAPPLPAEPGLDPIEARYRNGYGLFTAGKYPEAVKELEAFVAANPKHARASNAQFWAARSMLAQGQTAQAAKAFLAGYQNYPKGARAHNSLLWLSRTLIEMKVPQEACRVLDELKTSYPEKLTGQFASDVKATGAKAKCPA